MENSSPSNSKSAIRHIISLKRNQLTTEDISKKSFAIFQQACSCLHIQQAENILIYSPKGKEVQTHLFLKTFPEKHFYLPVIEKENIVAAHISDNMIKNAFGILEPAPPYQKLKEDAINVIITPAICVDKNGNRIGYGGGYYDRLFQRLRNQRLNPFKLSLIYDLQFSAEQLPTDVHDEKINAAATETQLVFF